MKKYYKKKRDDFPRVVKLIMAIVISLGVLQVPGQSLNNVMHAMDMDSKAVFSPITINNGASIYLGNTSSTYVGGNTILSDKTSSLTTGDIASITSGANSVYDFYYGKDRANSMTILKQNGLPTINDVKNWGTYIPKVSAGYWLNDVGEGIVQGRDIKFDISVPLRAVAKGDNTLINNNITINGKYESENPTDSNNGGLFIDRKLHLRDPKTGKYVDLGPYMNINPKALKFSSFIQKKGYYHDLLSKEGTTELGKATFVDVSWKEGLSIISYAIPGYLGDESYNSISKYYGLPVYSSPDFKEKRSISYMEAFGVGTSSGGLTIAIIYDDVSDTFRTPDPGEVIPAGTTIGFVHTDYDWVTDKRPNSHTGAILANKEGLLTFKTIKTVPAGYIDLTEDMTSASSVSQKINTKSYVLYAKTPIDLKAAKQDTALTITEGLRYVENDIPITGKNLEGTQNTVRPKMTIDTSKVKFARSHTSANITTNSTLGSLPTTTLSSTQTYKLVLNNDGLGINDITKGTTGIVTTGGVTDTAKVSQNNIIKVSPGTKQITIPVTTKGGNKVSAKSDTSYGIVGDVANGASNITINLTSLMDTNTKGSSKTITLFNEQLNAAGYSDEISTNGKELTIKVDELGVDFYRNYESNDNITLFSPVEMPEANYGGLVKAPASEPKREGYTFEGWYTARTGGVKWDFANTKIPADQEGRVNLYAQWKEISYDLTFDANGGNGGRIDKYTKGTLVTLPGIDAAGTKKEATLLGWNTKNDGLGVFYDVGKTYSMPGLNTTLYAHWKINEYKLTLDLNGGTYFDSNIPTVITKPYQTKVPLTDPTPPDKKVFTGWRVIGDTPLEGGFGIGDEKNTYTMGAGDVTVQALYKDMNQSIKFTDDTETMLKDNTYAYGEEFEVEAEAIEVDGHLPDKTKGIVFSTQDTDYLEIVGEPTWIPSTFKAKATFKVIKPLPEGDTNTLTIEINKPETDTHNAAQQVSSSDVKTEKRKIDLKIDSTIFVADKGEHRISLKAGEVMPDITQPPKIYKNGETTEDLVAIEDQKNNKIPYIVKTSHWLGNYTGLNGMNKDEVLIEDGKVSQKIAGNIWNLNIVEDTNSKEITWFEERYEVTGKSPIDAIVDVYDKTGNESITTSEILYVNNIAMSLKDYENKIANAVDKKQALINESNFKVTNMVAPYKEIKESVDSIDSLVRVLNGDSHAGEYEVQFNLYNGSGLRALLIVADVITKNILADEELRANTYIHQKGEPLLSDGAQGFLTLMKTEVIDLKTGKKKENMKFDVTIANPDVWKELGESTVNLKTDAGTEVTSKIIVRDHAVSKNDIRVSANDLALSSDEATALVNELSGKSIKEQASILTPTDPESKYGMYPYATNYVTGNRVLINNITGLPEISTSTGKVEAGVYDVTFETAGGGTVTAQIKVRTADPTAYVEIPAKIKLKKSNESNVVAEETDVVKLKTGVGVELDALKETILVETPSSFILKGISPSNTTTELNVDVYTQGENGETKHDGTVPFATLDSKNTEKKYILRIMKTLPKHQKDLYVGKMNFKISFGKAVPEGGG